MKQYLWLLVFKKCDILSLLIIARTSKKMYDLVEYYLQNNTNITHKYNSLVHYYCEEYICTKCFKCGNSYNLIYYRKNWNLKICCDCFPPYLNTFIKSSIFEPIWENKIQGFTQKELRKKLKYNNDITTFHNPKKYYNKYDIDKITRNRYGFNTFKSYQEFIQNRFDRINSKINKENYRKININHFLVKYYNFSKSNCGVVKHILENEVESIQKRINMAIKRFEICQANLKHNENKIVEQVEHHKVILRMKYNFISIHKIICVEDIGYNIFYHDKCFKYFKKRDVKF